MKLFYKVIYWDVPFLNKDLDSITIGGFIFVRPRMEGHQHEKALIEHEKVHVRQFYKSFGLFWPFYLFSKNKRLEYEGAAYRVSINNGIPVELCATYLSRDYGLDISYKEALKRLS